MWTSTRIDCLQVKAVNPHVYNQLIMSIVELTSVSSTIPVITFFN